MLTVFPSATHPLRHSQTRWVGSLLLGGDVNSFPSCFDVWQIRHNILSRNRWDVIVRQMAGMVVPLPVTVISLMGVS